MNSRRDADSVERLLKAWYGEREGAGELVRYLRKPVTLSEAVERAAQRLLTRNALNANMLQSRWEEVAGRDIAGKCTVLCVENGILYLEYRHPAFRLALDNRTMKQLILEKTNSVIGKETCVDVKFVPPGRRAK